MKLDPRDVFSKRISVSENGCWEWAGSRNEKGYGTCGLRGLATLAHRASWELFCGPIPEGMCVLHRCDNPPCVNPDHLFIGTVADNVADMRAKGRGIDAPRGEDHWRAELTEDQVLQISNDSRPNAIIAAERGVSRSTINRIKLGRDWGWLTGRQTKKRPATKMSPAQVAEIRDDPRSQRAIAADYGICKSAVGYIKRRQNWKDL